MNELDLDPDKTTEYRHTPQMEWRDLAQGRAVQSFRGHVEHVWDGQIAASRILHGLENEQPLRVFSIHLFLRNTVQDFFLCIIPLTINASNPTICTEMTTHKTPSLNLRQRQLVLRILSQNPKPGHSQQHLPYCSSICSTSITSAGKSVDTSDSRAGEEKRYAWRKAGQLYNAGLLDEQSRWG